MRTLLILCILGLAACGPEYYYQPAEQATATVLGRPAARYGIPPEQPRGDARVATFGVTNVDVGGDETVPSLHVRLIVSNDAGTAAWTLDTRDVRAQFAGRPPQAPTFVNASAEGLPLLPIPPGQSRTIDLFFPLPDDLRGAKDIPQFDVLWSVQTEDRRVAERTPFDRMVVEPAAVDAVVYGYGYGWAPYWWYDPFYPRVIVIHRPGPYRYYYGYPR
jgi:hypothetical protein